MIGITLTRSAAPMRVATRSFASSALVHAEAAAAAAAAAPRQRANNAASRPPRAAGSAAERLRAGERTRSSPRTNSGVAGNNRNGANHRGASNNRGAGGDRRNKRLPSVFDAASASRDRARGTSIKSQERRKLPAPVPTTDWNSALYAKPGYERFLAAAPRASAIFTPNLTATAPAPAAGKGKAKAATPTPAAAKLNLPGIKSAVNALKLHIRAGGRNLLGPAHQPIGSAVGSLTYNRTPLANIRAKGASDESLAADLKKARVALQNQQIGGSYERFQPKALLDAAGVRVKADGSVNAKAVTDAAHALSLNPDLAPESKSLVAKTIADRLGA